MKKRLLTFLAYAALLTAASAEYRVALVIADGDTKPVVAKLEKYGFRCDVTGSLTEKELTRKIEGWAGGTPTNSTALIYFEGAVRIQEDNGKKSASLMSSNDRIVPVALVFEIMDGRGGSRKNILVANRETAPALEEEIPKSCQFSAKDIEAALKEADVTGSGSIAVSPPDKFLPGSKVGDEWVDARGMVFCWCPPGKFTAGSPEGTPGRFPDEDRREVVIKDGFWIGKYEVTRSFNLRNTNNRSVGSHKNHPIEMLHWDDGRRDLHQVITEEERKAGRLPSSWEYDLPSGDQWEYAARSGTDTLYYFGDDMKLLPEHANFADKSFYDTGDIYSNHAHRTLDDGFVRLAPVGSFNPNPWGLHDVYGNVVEWCRDHSARGGGWVSVGENCRSAYVDSYSSRNEQIYLGYRIVIQPNAPEPAKK